MIQELLNAQMPVSTLGWIGFILAIIYLVLRFFQKRNDDREEVLDKSNDALRDLLDDQNKKIKKLDERICTLEKELETAKTEISELQKKNHSLEELVVRALTIYFANRPSEADQASQAIKGTKTPLVKVEVQQPLK